MKKIVSNYKKRKNTGALAILFVIIAFIFALFVSGMINTLTMIHFTREVQGIIDIAGVTSLKKGVELVDLREETFNFHSGKVKQNFIEIVEKETNKMRGLEDMRAGKKVNITKLRVVDMGRSDFGLGVYEKNRVDKKQGRHQAYIDSVIHIKIKGYKQAIKSKEDTFIMKDKYQNSTFEVNTKRDEETGEIILAIRSVSRIVYR